MKQWQWVKLGEVAEIKNGSTPSTLESDNFNGNIIWITPKDLSEQKTKYIYTSRKKITQKGYESCSTTLLPINTICLTSRAPIGLVSISKVELCTNQGFKNIIPDKKELYFEYLYYYLKYRTKDLIALGVGTKFKELTTPILKQYQIPLPPLQTQEKIARILSTIDDLIECNTRINKELESLLSVLYEMYFIRFDFPDTHNRPYQSSGGEMHYHPLLKRAIPKNWEVLNLYSRLDFERGKEFGKEAYLQSPKSKHCVKFYRVGDMIEGNSVYIDTSKYAKLPFCSEGDLLVSFDGSVGRVAYGINGAYCSGICKITDKQGAVNQAGLFCIFNDAHIQFTIHQYAVGTNILHAGRAIENLILPFNEEVFLAFQHKATPLFMKMRENKILNHHLASLRDFLLPLLMNGEIEVGEKKTKR
ncbi:restriction endonuclease subunit S [Helicobacter sp. MIT 05-5293]|uniref:restriction endonuclease subunit S n=1 Tax=Helicobacter sp. MIT 05-5293 TaxID=1548149 RepID=UPI00068F5D4D|nr:restriction endonuclease subunit S [Helicobacter sp. MIT 05-5293]TLD80900.1 restriction endonuclease subunit S [Helicobacter sp. MIT 05-5293]